MEYKNKATELPNQMVSSKVKQSKKWQEESIDYFINNLYNQNNNIRKNRSDMYSNIRFVNSIPNIEDLRDSFDPLKMSGSDEDYDNLPLKTKFYNIIGNPLKTLFGEELKRRSDIRAVVTNQLAINKKDEEFNKKLFNYFMQEAQKESTNEEELQKKLKELDRFGKYDLQSAHEKMANEIIQIISNNRDINIKRIFNDGFKSLNIIGEEIFRIGNIGDEPWLFNVDSTNFYVFGLGNSKWIHDGYAWIEEDYLHPNRIVEEFNRELTDIQIKKILDRNFDGINFGHITPLTGSELGEKGKILTSSFNSVSSNGEFFYLDSEGSNSDYFDSDGNIRVVRMQWLSLRKIGELKYYDEFGDEQYMFVDEYYKPDENLGEEIKWFWINEIMKGGKIGDIYLEVKPLEVQMRSIINPAIVIPSYIGVINTTMKGKARCIVDDIKPYQEDFNIWFLKLKQLWTQHLGKAAIIDISRIPSDMNLEEWYKWLSLFGISFENPFEESSKGELAGRMNQNSRNIDLSHAEEINQAIQMLSYLEQMVNKIASVPEPRQGDLTGKEGLGISQEAISRSSTQTEDIFQLHEDVKAFCYRGLIEFTKVLWKDKKIKRQYQLDDLSNYIIDIDGAELNEAEYGIQVTNSSRLYEVENTLKQLAHAGMQSGTISLSDVGDMLIATSSAEMLVRLKQAEETKYKQQQEAQQMQLQAQQQQMEAQSQLEQMKHQMALEKMDKEYSYKIEIEKMKLEDNADKDVFNMYANDENRNGVEDQVEIDTENIRAEVKKEEIKSKEKMFYDELRVKEKLEREKIAAQKEIARQNAIKKIKSNKN